MTSKLKNQLGEQVAANQNLISQTIEATNQISAQHEINQTKQLLSQEQDLTKKLREQENKIIAIQQETTEMVNSTFREVHEKMAPWLAALREENELLKATLRENKQAMEFLTKENNELTSEAQKLQAELQHTPTLQQAQQYMRKHKIDVFDLIALDDISALSDAEQCISKLKAKLELLKTKRTSIQQRQIENLQDQLHWSECPICIDQKKDVSLVPCGHSMCKACSELVLSKTKNCPICRNPVQTQIPMYL